MPPSPVRIFLVDDFAPLRKELSLILQNHTRFQIVGETGDGLDAVRIAKELKPDLILLDIGLPNLNGIQVAEQIQSDAPAVKIIFVTQIDDPEVVRAAVDCGSRGYVLKSEAQRELLQTIEDVLVGKSFVSRRLRKLLL